MSVIYIGSIYPPGCIEKLKMIGSSIDFAAETFQTSLLQGLCEYYPNLKVVTASNISSYPLINKKFFSKEIFTLPFSKDTHYFTGFCNITIFKQISKCVRIRKTIKQILEKGSNNIIILYGVHSPFLLIVRVSPHNHGFVIPSRRRP